MKTTIEPQTRLQERNQGMPDLCLRLRRRMLRIPIQLSEESSVHHPFRLLREKIVGEGSLSVSEA